MIPKYVLYSFLLLPILTIPLTRIPFHPMVEIQFILFTILGLYPFCIFFKNIKLLLRNCKFLTYGYILILISCAIGIIRHIIKPSEGLLLFDIYKAYMALLSMAWIFVPIIDKSTLGQVVHFCFRKVFAVWLLVLLPFYRIGFTVSYLEIFLPFLLFYKFASRKVRIILILYSICFFIYPGQRTNLLMFLMVWAIFLLEKISFLRTKTTMKILSWTFYLMPFVCILLFMYKGFNIFDFSSYLNSEEQYGQEKLFDDTRTGLYIESYNSIMNHGTWLFGETPALGYDSLWRSQYYLTTHVIQRYCEVCIVNIYVWFGLLGLVLFCYFWGDIVKKSLNLGSTIAVLLGTYISLYYMVCWLENCNCWISVRAIFVYLFIGYIIQAKKMNMTGYDMEKEFQKMLN